MITQVIFPGCKDIEEHEGLLEALESIVTRGKQDNFLIKPSLGSEWEDGARLMKSMKAMFAPVYEKEDAVDEQEMVENFQKFFNKNAVKQGTMKITQALLNGDYKRLHIYPDTIYTDHPDVTYLLIKELFEAEARFKLTPTDKGEYMLVVINPLEDIH